MCGIAVLYKPVFNSSTTLQAVADISIILKVSVHNTGLVQINQGKIKQTSVNTVTILHIEECLLDLTYFKTVRIKQFTSALNINSFPNCIISLLYAYENNSDVQWKITEHFCEVNVPCGIIIDFGDVVI